MFQELFNEMSHVESLKIICATSKKIPIVDLREKDEKKLTRFWKTVRLYLPPIRGAFREDEALLPCKESYTSQQC